SFESRFARSGGLAAVTMNILPFLKETNRIPRVSLISPYYPKIMDKAPLNDTGKKFRVFFDNRFVDTELLQYEYQYDKPAKGKLAEYYLKADGFFTASNGLKDPYYYDAQNADLNDEAIRYNAMFFCKAVPAAVATLGIKENALFHAQEWQTCLLALTAKEAIINDVLRSCAVVQTIHNPFDSFISAQSLQKMVDEPRKLRIDHMLAQGATAYQIGLPLMDGPTTTVSEHFAEEFTTDPLQTQHFAPHLQGIFMKNKVYGINNGPFTGYAAEFPKKSKHTLKQIEKIKLEKRRELLKVLDTYQPEARFGILDYQGTSIENLPVEIPIIVMSGRLDPVQKGYDILLRALEMFKKDEIKAILTPMPVRSTDLDYFHEVASKCRGNVTVFPIRMEYGYQALQIGATFGIMPSVYEPFGAAIEYMVNGTAVIARATGGLVNQVEHGKNGYLFLENPRYQDLDHIRDYFAASDVVQIRKRNEWVQDMAEALYSALQSGIELYQKNPPGYYEMLRQGFAKAEKFSWETSAALYGLVYGKISHII
ncbi:glycogen/starch synthase, partial [candidate division KSB1 bacterium]|nr:glycogen/starch synthase [candidate division KSB1 bacterium]